MPGGKSCVQHAAGAVEQHLFRALGNHFLQEPRRARAADEGLEDAHVLSVPVQLVDWNVPPTPERGVNLCLADILQDMEGFVRKGEDNCFGEALLRSIHGRRLQNFLRIRIKGIK